MPVSNDNNAMIACPPILELDHVSRRRAGRPAITDLSVRLDAGQALGLLGVNGTGKSTTLAMVAGALTPDCGAIRLCGEDFIEHPELARRIIGWLVCYRKDSGNGSGWRAPCCINPLYWCSMNWQHFAVRRGGAGAGHHAVADHVHLGR